MSAFLRLCALALFLVTGTAQALDQAKQVSPGTIPYREEKPVQDSATNAIVASVVLIGLAGTVLLLVRRRLRPSRGTKEGMRALTVLDSIRLGSAARVWVIDFEGERLLVAQSGNQLALLASHSASSPSGPIRREAV